MKHFLALLAAASMLAACVPPEPKPRPAPAVPSAPVMKVSEPGSIERIGQIPAEATPVKVGLLVPLSGDSAALGNTMLDAATLALMDEYMSSPTSQIKSQIVLIPKDTGDNSASAAKAAQEAIDAGATVLVGPLFSQAVTAIKPLVKARRIPVISFSNNRAVAEPNIYTYGYLPEQQIARIAEYAYLQGITRVALLAPNDAYGQKVRDELSYQYTQRGGFVTPIELYAPSDLNIEAAVARLTAAYENTAAERKMQALFIADSGYSLPSIMKALARSPLDLSKIRIFGAGMWDDPSITEIPELAGAQFPGTPPDTYLNFNRRFAAMYGTKNPPRLASLSYDAISLLARLTIASPSATVNPARIPTPDGYVGLANGLYRLTPDGTSERKLAILEVTPNGLKVVDQAKKSFAPAGM